MKKELFEQLKDIKERLEACRPLTGGIGYGPWSQWPNIDKLILELEEIYSTSPVTHPDIPCSIQTRGKRIELADVTDVWCDGVELHLDNSGNVKVLIRKGFNDCISIDVPINMRGSKHNNKEEK